MGSFPRKDFLLEFPWHLFNSMTAVKFQHFQVFQSSGHSVNMHVASVSDILCVKLSIWCYHLATLQGILGLGFWRARGLRIVWSVVVRDRLGGWFHGLCYDRAATADGDGCGWWLFSTAAAWSLGLPPRSPTGGDFCCTTGSTGHRSRLNTAAFTLRCVCVCR